MHAEARVLLPDRPNGLEAVASGISQVENLVAGAKPNNGMHLTADTNTLMFRERCGAAGDAGR
jgi:hypothetical protein